MNAATIVCLRAARKSVTQLATGNTGNYPSARNQGFEVLLGQNECKNWLRSSPENEVIMRYPGEWKFPGGAVDSSDKSFKDTALRELSEEFLGLDIPSEVAADSILLFNTKLTRPIQNRRYQMYNYVALVDDANADWINDQVLEKINQALQQKRSTFEEMLASGRYWDMSKEEKMQYSPEVVRVKWFPLEDAIEMMDDSTVFVDDWQRRHFEKYQIPKRDPMHVTAESLAEIRDHEDMRSVRASAELFSRKMLHESVS